MYPSSTFLGYLLLACLLFGFAFQGTSAGAIDNCPSLAQNLAENGAKAFLTFGQVNGHLLMLTNEMNVYNFPASRLDHGRLYLGGLTSTELLVKWPAIGKDDVFGLPAALNSANFITFQMGPNEGTLQLISPRGDKFVSMWCNINLAECHRLNVMHNDTTLKDYFAFINSHEDHSFYSLGANMSITKYSIKGNMTVKTGPAMYLCYDFTNNSTKPVEQLVFSNQSCTPQNVSKPVLSRFAGFISRNHTYLFGEHVIYIFEMPTTVAPSASVNMTLVSYKDFITCDNQPGTASRIILGITVPVFIAIVCVIVFMLIVGFIIGIVYARKQFRGKILTVSQ